MIGERGGLPPDIRALIEEAEAVSRDNQRVIVIMALNYGGRHEITEAARRLAAEAQAGRLDPDGDRRGAVRGAARHGGMPDPDLLIRTSGEQRISNFLLWQLAYTELVFIPFSWPDFAEEHLREALREYHRRERRYGASAG